MKKSAKRKIGTSLLMSAIVAGSAVIPLANPKAEETPNLKYSAHVENIGWQDMVGTGKYAGTEGQALRLEAIKVQRENLDGVELTFDVHIENEGWKNNLKETDVIGSEGKAQRLEAIRVRSKGLTEKGYKLQYKVHVEDLGWTDWINEGEMAGTEGQAKRVEAIEFRLVKVTDLKLEIAKKDALNQLNKEYKAADYTINAKAFEKAMTDGQKAINEATDVASVTKALEDVLTELKKVPSDKAELAGLDSSKNETVTEFINELAEYATAANGASSIKSAIESTRKAGTNLIDNAASIGSVATAKTTALENAVKAARNAAQTELDRLYKSGVKDSNGKVKYLKETAYQTATKDIEAALKNDNKDTNKDRISTIVTAYTTAIADANILTLDAIRSDASDLLTQLDTEVKATMFTDVDAIKSAINTGDKALETASTRDEISKAVQTAIDTVLSLAKTEARAKLDKLYNNGNAVDCFMLSRSDYNTAVKEVNNATSVTEINTAYETAEGKKTKFKYAEEAITALEAIKTKSDISSIIKEAKSIISQATTVSKVAATKEDAEAKILASEKSYYVSEINKLATSIDSTKKLYYRQDICNEVKSDVNNASTLAEVTTAYESLATKAASAYTEKFA